MGRNIKRLSLALIALGLSAPVLAYSGSPFCVTVPNQQGGFTVGADALYLRPSAGNHTYDVTIGTPASLVTPVFPITLNSIDPGYHWGFDVMAAYRIPCTGNDISVTWTHLGRTSDTNDNVHDFAGFVIPSPPAPEPITIPAGTLTASAETQFKYDAVDLDLGQRVNFGDYFNLRMLAGVRFADLQQQLNATYTVASPVAVPATLAILSLDQNSEFKGVGPQFGLEGRYCFGYGFGIDASSTISALVGRTDSDAQFAATFFPGTTFTTSTAIDICQERKTRVVPALDANLGVDYTFNFNNCSRSSLVVQAGYKVIHYWDVTHFIVSNSGPNIATPASFDGPYLGLKVNV